MGVGSSRIYHRPRRLIRKRMSLPMHLIASKTDGREETRQDLCTSNYSSPGPFTNKMKTVFSWSCMEHTDSFSEFEEDVLLSTWPLISSDMIGHGCTVFRIAFSIFPDLASFFPLLQFNEDSSPANEATRLHISNFMAVFSRAIQALNGDREEFYQEMMLLGAKHASVPGMKIEYFKVFKQAILLTCEQVMNEEFTDDVRSAWTHFLDTLIDLLIEGCLVFEEEEDKLLLSADPDANNPAGTCPFTRRRNGRPSVISMTPEELAQFYSACR